jgi:beta-N-acetylhexosaminidase
VLNQMTEAQRVGQLFMIGLMDDQLNGNDQAAIGTWHFGSVLFAQHTTAGVAAIRAQSNAIQAQATQPNTDGVPFFVAANQEGGRAQGLSGPGFDAMPSALFQGGFSPAQLQTLASRWGSQLGSAGINLNLAPVADVVPPGTDAANAPIGQLQREYGHDPAAVASHVAAFIAGMQAAGIFTAAKHFPGLGRVHGNTDFTSDVVDTVTMPGDPYLAPFAVAIEAGAPFVMISEATYTRIDARHQAVFSDTVINGMLRGTLGFRGVVISDSLGANAVLGLSPATRAIGFLDAGGDMIVLNQIDQAQQMAAAVLSYANGRAWFRARVDNAAWHVLHAKEAAGLLRCG